MSLTSFRPGSAILTEVKEMYKQVVRKKLVIKSGIRNKSREEVIATFNNVWTNLEVGKF